MSKELKVKTEVVNEQLSVISMKDDKIATQKLELEKVKDGMCSDDKKAVQCYENHIQ